MAYRERKTSNGFTQPFFREESRAACLTGRQGFTLLEILLSVGILTILSTVGAVVLQAFQSKNDFSRTITTAAQTLRRAEVLAEASDGDSSWGMHVVTGSLTLFKGASFATRSSTFDEVFDVPSAISATGTKDFVFTKMYGFPQATGTLIFVSAENQTSSVIVNEKGMVAY